VFLGKRRKTPKRFKWRRMPQENLRLRFTAHPVKSAKRLLRFRPVNWFRTQDVPKPTLSAFRSRLRHIFASPGISSICPSPAG
jgi:hypothetical protein